MNNNDSKNQFKNLPEYTYPPILGETHLYYGDKHNQILKYLTKKKQIQGE